MKSCKKTPMHLSGKGRILFQTLPGNTALCSSSSYKENAIRCLLNILRQLRLLRKPSEIKNGDTLQALTSVPLLCEFLENAIWQADPLKWPTSKILCTRWTNHTTHSQAKAAEKHCEVTTAICYLETLTGCSGCERLNWRIEKSETDGWAKSPAEIFASKTEKSWPRILPRAVSLFLHLRKQAGLRVYKQLQLPTAGQ